MWVGCGLSRGSGPLYMLGLKRAPVTMGRLRRRCCQACKCEEENVVLGKLKKIWGRTYEHVVDYSPHLDVFSASIDETSESLKNSTKAFITLLGFVENVEPLAIAA